VLGSTTTSAGTWVNSRSAESMTFPDAKLGGQLPSNYLSTTGKAANADKQRTPFRWAKPTRCPRVRSRGTGSSPSFSRRRTETRASSRRRRSRRGIDSDCPRLLPTEVAASISTQALAHHALTPELHREAWSYTDPEPASVR
jgi:hypothetical protein